MSPEYVSELLPANSPRTKYPYVKEQTTLAIRKPQLWPKDHFIPLTQTVEQLYQQL